MIVKSASDVPEKQITSYPYKGKPLPVQETYIRWLSQAGPKDSPEYGLRFFRLGPSGAIPIHNHQYYQTMYILSGQLAVTSYASAADAPIEEKMMHPGDFVFVPSMEPHSIRNLSSTENATFLCCIGVACSDETM
jgi:quercetin dioxygenase-like cupin family protein